MQIGREQITEGARWRAQELRLLRQRLVEFYPAFPLDSHFHKSGLTGIVIEHCCIRQLERSLHVAHTSWIPPALIFFRYVVATLHHPDVYTGKIDVDRLGTYKQQESLVPCGLRFFHHAQVRVARKCCLNGAKSCLFASSSAAACRTALPALMADALCAPDSAWSDRAIASGSSTGAPCRLSRFHLESVLFPLPFGPAMIVNRGN